MPAPISVVIPTLNAARQLPETLGCLLEGLEMGLLRELIVSDGGSADATLQIADEFGARLVHGEPGRGGQLRRGAALARGEWLLFLHADTHLAPGWSSAVQAHLASAERAGYFRLSFRASGLRPRLVAFGANIRSRLGLPYGDQGLLVSGALYDRVGGYDNIPLMEDVDLVRRLRGRLTMLDSLARTDASRYEKSGWFRRAASNLLVLTRYQLGASPENLLKYYDRE